MLSILLPTRNGAAYLADCVRAVLDQAGDDFELIVSDNANDDGTPEILAGFGDDPRLRVVRNDQLLGVTQNWLRAFDAARGDHVLMLGDDDLLLPGAIARLRALLAEPPDCLTYNAYSYVFPTAMAGVEGGRYSERHFRFDDSFESGRALDVGTRRRLVDDMFRFRPRIPLNMQTTVFSRALASEIPGGVFQEPFPDHFALNAMLLLAERWEFVDERLLVIGVSPKSFGHYVYSSRSDAGLSYLGIDTAFEGWLPGNELLSAMYIWLEKLKRTFPEEMRDVEVSRGDYVARQVWSLVQQWRLGAIRLGDVASALRRLSARDWLAMAATAADVELLGTAARRLRRGRGDRVELLWEGLAPLEPGTSIAQFAAARPVSS
jgi:glycosyltransferase involved in cell wall biosynthesis